ncbi:MAG: hypothetical protein EAZ11_07495 [Curvibacter sp.]|nr:MAG: hypothetical protein EAZ11_07495 [Curvibacter sp.]
MAIKKTIRQTRKQVCFCWLSGNNDIPVLKNIRMHDFNQPNAGARLVEVDASKLTVIPLLPPTALEQADRKWVDPLYA